MKHSSSTHFSGLPLDTNTLAGQWMTFSHMANHYRKLLNVKPRVNTGLPSNHHTSHSFHNFTTMTTLPSSKSNNKLSCPKPKKADNSNSTSHKNKQKDVLYSSIPGDLNISENLSRKELKSPKKSNSKSGNTKKQSKQQKVQQYPEYQVVFGPSSIQSSSEAAFVSDETDSLLSNGKSPSEIQPPIGVTEKIRRFLNHIHQLDLTSSKKPKRVSTAQCISPSKKSPGKKSEGRPVTLRTPSSNISTNNQIDYRLYRHSKCFDTGEKSPRKTQAKTSLVCTNPVSPYKKRPQSLSSSVSSLNNRKQLGKKLVITVDHSDHNQHPQRSYNYSTNNHFQGTPRATRSKLTGSGVEVRSKTPERDCNKSGRHGKNRRRAESVISIGTVCGSDELTAEDFPLSIKDICATLESGLIGDDHDDILLNRILEDNAQLQKQKKKSSMKTKSSRQILSSEPHATSSTRNLLRSNSMTSLVPSSSKSNTAGGNIMNGTNNNKDSSRDSAYGFSSGESRITTRESTPEKKCSTSFQLLGKSRSKSKHNLGDNDFAVQDKHLTAETDLHPNSSNNNNDVPLGRKISSKDKFRTKNDGSCSSLKSKTKATADTKRRVSSERYITFLAELTQDIVSKGIYTNKGLKLLFKSHLEQNKELNPDKLADMVEHLRMDLGIPKDDALDKIEFGYGSVSDATSTTFFYSTAQSQEKLTTESILFKAKVGLTPGTGALSETIDNSSLPHSTSTTPSPTTIIPLAIQKESEVGTTTTTGFSSSGGINSSNNSTTTTEEGSGDITGVLNSDLDLEKNNVEEDEQEEDDEAELDLLSEAEATEVLRIAGLDDGLTKEVLGILKG